MTKKKPVTNAAIGKRLRAVREKASMTQAELGEAMGVSYQSVSQYEHGRAAMSALQLVQAAHAMGCSTLDLLP